ncbi:small EDRK-rich factor 2-like [Cervus elaphus]|uniref:small EDRK-rich factor 2-like n=1 Tax=Cervus canadensis TaxID=1574408 RepID=UPI001CA34369|nr:small EDRK-rich factor 2-like [Cervus canadensis]XP_043764812.1 small EDRK-rich factor 2-like [Cervus elaphus]
MGLPPWLSGDATEAGRSGCHRQRKLALQKNVKKQSDSVKGNRRDDGLPAAAPKERDSEIMQQKQKKAKEKKEEPR